MSVDTKPAARCPLAVGAKSRKGLEALWRNILCGCLTTLVCALGTAVAFADPGPVSEHKVKAAVAFNVARFANWPTTPDPSAEEPFVFCVAGGGPLAEAINELEGKTLKDRPVVVRQGIQLSSSALCQVIVVTDQGGWPGGGMHGWESRKGVLTIGDVPEFAERGGLVGLFVQAGKVRFEVNLAAAARADIRFSPNLLRLATIVGDQTP